VSCVEDGDGYVSSRSDTTFCLTRKSKALTTEDTEEQGDTEDHAEVSASICLTQFAGLQTLSFLLARVELRKLLLQVRYLRRIVVDDVGVIGMKDGVILVIGFGGIKSL
jgi:hypothetical protein